MSKKLIKQLSQYQYLYRDDKNGIAWIEDGNYGLGHSCHANIDASGSTTGMKNFGYWDKSDRIICSHGFKYNIDKFVIDKDNLLDVIVANTCMCQACIERRENHGFLMEQKFIRKLQKGDFIRAYGLKIEINEILAQDFYICDYDLNRSYVDIEFTDVNKKYHHYKSNLDGGCWIYKEN